MVTARIRLTAVAVSAGLLLAACSSGGGSGASLNKEEQPYADAIAKSMTTASETDPVVLDQKQADCVAGRFVNIIGVDTMKDAGVTPADLTNDDGFLDDDGALGDLKLDEKQANDLYDSFGNCDVDFRELMFESMTADEDTPQESVECLKGALTEDLLRNMMVNSFMGMDDEDSPEAMQLMGAIMGCMFAGMDEGDFDMDFDDDFDFDFEFDDD